MEPPPAEEPYTWTAKDVRQLQAQLQVLQEEAQRVRPATTASKNNIELVLQLVEPFTGEDLAWSAATWAKQASAALQEFAPGSSDRAVILILRKLIKGKAKAAMAGTFPATADQLLSMLERMFSARQYEERVRQAIAKNRLFVGISSAALGEFAIRVYDNLEPTDASAALVAQALCVKIPHAFKSGSILVDAVTKDNIYDVCRTTAERAYMQERVDETVAQAQPQETRGGAGPATAKAMGKGPAA